MIRFLLVITLSALLLAGFTWMAHSQQWIRGFPSFFYQTLIFLVFATTTIFAYLYHTNKADFFVQLYLLTMVVKFLAYGVYNLFMIMEDKDGAALNVVFFMILYIVFTTLVITFLYRRISNSRPR